MKARGVMLVAALAALVFSAPAFGGSEKWPTPIAGWWKSVKAGDKAEYEMQMAGTTANMVITVTDIKGSSITVTVESRFNGESQPAQRQTFDAAKEANGLGPDLPPNAVLEKGATEVVAAAGLSFPCTVYHFSVDGTSTKVWYSPRLPGVFSGGVVKMEIIAPGDIKGTLSLRSFKGTLLSAPVKGE